MKSILPVPTMHYWTSQLPFVGRRSPIMHTVHLLPAAHIIIMSSKPCNTVRGSKPFPSNTIFIEGEDYLFMTELISAEQRGSISFRPHARLIRLLGDELISDEIMATVELVKNGYDADATTVSISLDHAT